MIIDLQYRIKNDTEFLLESEGINYLKRAEKTGISCSTLNSISKNETVSYETHEKIYSYLYEHGYKINSVKEDLIKEKYKNVLFHESKFGLSEISADGSRNICDFGKGFYL